jgi:ParB family chromosome partitioning protein
MNKMKPGLGRGLDALINPHNKADMNSNNLINVPTDKVSGDDGKTNDIIVKIPINVISPNPFQPRTEFAPKALEELKKSILENGLIQPITVRRAPGNRYELISGERRLRACKDIGYREITAYIIKVDSNEAMLALSLIENIQREELNPIETALAYKRLMEECSLSQEEIAEKVGKDRTTITNSIRLLKLPKAVQDSLIKDEISAGHARALINLPSEELQVEILNKIKKEQLSVRKVELVVKNIANLIKKNEDNVKTTEMTAIVQKDIENKLRNIFGTKVSCKQKKDGSGSVTIEFYSNDELERLFELFEVINKNYN